MNDSVKEALGQISTLPNRFREESRLQLEVAKILTSRGVPHTEEARLTTRERIDFLLPGRIGIELKTKGQSLAIARQLYRYADHLEEIVLVTTTPVSIDSGSLADSKGRRVPLTVINLWSNPT